MERTYKTLNRNLRNYLTVDGFVHFLLHDPRRYLEPGQRRTGVGGPCTWRIDGVDPVSGRRRLGRRQFDSKDEVLRSIAATEQTADCCLQTDAVGFRIIMDKLDACPCCRMWRQETEGIA